MVDAEEREAVGGPEARASGAPGEEDAAMSAEGALRLEQEESISPTQDFVPEEAHEEEWAPDVAPAE
eukprot:11145581-Alexandrium_andersonii.AAC.1